MKEKLRLKDGREMLLENLLNITLREDKVLEEIKYAGVEKRELSKKLKILTHNLDKIREEKKPLVDKLR